MEATVFQDAQGAVAARAASQRQGDARAPEGPAVAEVDRPPCGGPAAPDADANRPYPAPSFTSASFTSATFTSATGAPVIRRNASAVVRNT